MCPQCGNLRSVCSDPSIDWHTQTVTCWASASVEWGQRRLQEKYAKYEPPPDENHPLDGLSVWASRTDFDPESGDFD